MLKTQSIKVSIKWQVIKYKNPFQRWNVRKSKPKWLIFDRIIATSHWKYFLQIYVLQQIQFSKLVNKFSQYIKIQFTKIEACNCINGTQKMISFKVASQRLFSHFLRFLKFLKISKEQLANLRAASQWLLLDHFQFLYSMLWHFWKEYKICLHEKLV